MFRAIKYELKPNNEQKTLLNKTFGCCRYIYNTMLAEKIRAYKEEKKSLSAYDLMKQITLLKKQPETEWLKEVPSKALQQSVVNLERAYSNFFRQEKVGFPKFKKKGDKDSFRISRPCRVDYEKWTVKVEKIGNIKIYKGHNKQIDGNIRQYTITHTTTDRYFISILYEAENKQPLNNNKAVGIDVGIKTLATLSDGTLFENQKYLKQNLKKLRVLERSASRKYKQNVKREDQSKNWHKTIKQIAKLHEKIRFEREDYLHKVSRYIADNYSTVCIEDLNIKEMERNRHLSQAISDCGWGKFVEMLTYKCDEVIKVDRFFASSQICSECGCVNKKVKNLAVRKWTCPNCGAIHDRDVNASKNILRAGLARCTLSTQ